MATLATTSVLHAGTAIPFVAASSGGDAGQIGKTLLVTNGDTASHTVTLAAHGSVDGLTVANRTVTVAASATAAIPLTSVYDGGSGLATITYDAVTAVKVAVVSI